MFLVWDEVFFRWKIKSSAFLNFERFQKGTLGQKLINIWWKNMLLKSLEALVPQPAKSGESGLWVTTPSCKMLNICLQSLKKPSNCLNLKLKTLNKRIFLTLYKPFGYESGNQIKPSWNFRPHRRKLGYFLT